MIVLTNIVEFDLLSGIVYTRDENLQSRLGNVQTYRITLALAYILYCLSAT